VQRPIAHHPTFTAVTSPFGSGAIVVLPIIQQLGAVHIIVPDAKTWFVAMGHCGSDVYHTRSITVARVWIRGGIGVGPCIPASVDDSHLVHVVVSIKLSLYNMRIALSCDTVAHGVQRPYILETHEIIGEDADRRVVSDYVHLDPIPFRHLQLFLEPDDLSMCNSIVIGCVGEAVPYRPVVRVEGDDAEFAGDGIGGVPSGLSESEEGGGREPWRPQICDIVVEPS